LGPFITGLAKIHACNLYLCYLVILFSSFFIIHYSFLFLFFYSFILCFIFLIPLIVAACMWCAKEGACWSKNIVDTCQKCERTSDWCCNEEEQGYIYIGDIPISYGSVYAYSLSASAVIQVIVLPFIGAFGDSTKNPKLFLFIVTVLSSLLLVLMLTVTRPALFWVATLFAILGNVLYAMDNVFYNALLINVASPKEQNFVSSLGYAVGYVGGGIMLVIALVVYLIVPGYQTIRIMMAVCGIWWLIFSSITFKRVTSTEPRLDPIDDIPTETSSIAESENREKIENENRPNSENDKLENSAEIPSENSPHKSIAPTDSLPPFSQIVATSLEEEEGGIIKRAILQLWRTLRLLWRIPHTLLFLVASAIFNDGISTVASLSGTYATEALDATFTTLAILALITNFAGIAGAFFFNWIAKKITAKIAILISLVLWCGIVVWGYLVQSISQLYAIGFLIGVGLGSSQPLSRSLLANMIPKGYENQIFSFYELTQRGTSWIGPLVYASVTSKNHNNPRPGIIVLIVFFVIGGFLLCFVRVPTAIRHAKLIDEEKNKQ